MRQELEKITGYRGSEKTYEEYFAQIDLLGRFNLKTVLQILVVICNKMDGLKEMESNINAMNEEIEHYKKVLLEREKSIKREEKLSSDSQEVKL